MTMLPIEAVVDIGEARVERVEELPELLVRVVVAGLVAQEAAERKNIVPPLSYLLRSVNQHRDTEGVIVVVPPDLPVLRAAGARVYHCAVVGCVPCKSEVVNDALEGPVDGPEKRIIGTGQRSAHLADVAWVAGEQGEEDRQLLLLRRARHCATELVLSAGLVVVEAPVAEGVDHRPETGAVHQIVREASGEVSGVVDFVDDGAGAGAGGRSGCCRAAVVVGEVAVLAADQMA
mmetsp:Transcript_20912/g.28428  ORF Transcript_20912/g.28428 Transcript_20912/m.28428 type:complete len:233 (-) Transcript_20912:377-1075(-)